LIAHSYIFKDNVVHAYIASIKMENAKYI